MARSGLYNLDHWFALAHRSSYHPAELARELRISPRQLRRYTQDLFDSSPRDWLNRRRLIVAADLLKQQLPVKTVAFDLGFKQLSHFSREFKRQYGLSPTAFAAANNPHPITPPANQLHLKFAPHVRAR